MSKCRIVQCMNPPKDWTKCRESETVLITGDGRTLPDDVKQFESWQVPHDVFCVNRSLLYFQRPINHWAAVDAEESVWFSQYCNSDVLPKGKWIWRHIIGVCRGYDFYWQGFGTFNTAASRIIWPGNSGYFAMMAALEIGYTKVILAGMPLDRNPCWYEPEDKPGPNWIGAMYTQWMDWKMESPKADRVRSMGGYSAFILGNATKEWCEK